MPLALHIPRKYAHNPAKNPLFSPLPKKHMGNCKKHEPYISKYIARILKYMPYIFRHFKLLINNNLQKQSKTL